MVSGSATDLKNQLDFCSWNFAGAGNDPVQNLCPMTRIVIPNNTTLCSLHGLLKLPTKLESDTCLSRNDALGRHRQGDSREDRRRGVLSS